MFPRDLLIAPNVEAEIFRPGTFTIPMSVRADAATIDKIARALIESKSPLLRAGTDVWRSNGIPQIVELAELLAIPVTSGEEREGFRVSCNFPTNHPLFLGGYSRNMRYPRNVDLILNMGGKLPDPGVGQPQISRSTKLVMFASKPPTLVPTIPSTSASRRIPSKLRLISSRRSNPWSPPSVWRKFVAIAWSRPSSSPRASARPACKP
jgi:thiamine pyrophosphate-dependent acetolactate synthase large subunit-like protein